MKQTITFRCDVCKKSSEMDTCPGDLTCPHCTRKRGAIESIEAIFHQCPICECRQFYLSKDFNQALGFIFIGVGIVLVPWTYGLSLPVFALMDWFLYKRVPTIANCYRCRSLFRGFEVPNHFQPFDHHTALQYEKYRQ